MGWILRDETEYILGQHPLDTSSRYARSNKSFDRKTKQVDRWAAPALMAFFSDVCPQDTQKAFAPDSAKLYNNPHVT